MNSRIFFTFADAADAEKTVDLIGKDQPVSLVPPQGSGIDPVLHTCMYGNVNFGCKLRRRLRLQEVVDRHSSATFVFVWHVLRPMDPEASTFIAQSWGVPVIRMQCTQDHLSPVCTPAAGALSSIAVDGSTLDEDFMHGLERFGLKDRFAREEE